MCNFKYKDIQFFNNTRICLITDFSLKKFLTKKRLPQLVQQLPVINVLQVLEQNGVREYMQSTQCSTRGQIYKPSVNGWKNGNSRCNVHFYFLHIIVI